MYGARQLDGVAQNDTIRELLAVIGLLFVAYAIFAFDETVPFPSIHALVPTIGAALIILFTTTGTAVGRALGHRALVGVGLISYSADLWHQPIFAFARHRSLTEPGSLLYAALSLLTIVLAYVSWRYRYVEKPFRKRGIVDREQVFRFAVAGSAVFIAIGVSGHFANGFDHRKASDGTSLSELDDRIKVNYGLSEVCDGPLALEAHCRTSDNPEILVWATLSQCILCKELFHRTLQQRSYK